MYIFKPKLVVSIVLIVGLSACQQASNETVAMSEPTTHGQSEPTWSDPNCQYLGLFNSRIPDGFGMNICPDGTIVNGDGLLVGEVVSRDGGQITVNWTNQPVLGIEVFQLQDWS